MPATGYCSDRSILGRFTVATPRATIARQCGCSREHVDRVLAAHHRRVPSVAVGDALAIVAAYQGGQPIYKLARDVGLSQANVTLVLVAAGVAIAPPGRRPAADYSDPLACAQLVAAFHAEGADGLAARLQCSRSTAYRRYRAAAKIGTGTTRTGDSVR